RPAARALAAQVELFLDAVASLPWDDDAADRYGFVRVQLERAGTPIGNLDTMIAAHALATQVVLISNNGRHFRLVKGPAVENWLVT
ncbi:MAG: PIN domain-containing protein, partial [Vulcanimicrobiaceae bacterium]